MVEIEPAHVITILIAISGYIVLRFEWFCRRLSKLVNVVKKTHPKEAKEEGL